MEAKQPLYYWELTPQAVSFLMGKETTYFFLVFNYMRGFELLCKGKVIHRRLRGEFVISQQQYVNSLNKVRQCLIHHSKKKRYINKVACLTTLL